MSIPQDLPSNVTALPRGGRDGFIAETAIRLDRLETSTARLQQDMDNARAALVALLESAEQTKRLRQFEESLRNSREYKIDEMVRTSRDLKGRLDRIEGERATFAALHYNSFETVSRRLQKLGRLEEAVAQSKAEVRRASGMLYATALVAAGTFAAYFAPALGLG